MSAIREWWLRCASDSRAQAGAQRRGLLCFATLFIVLIFAVWWGLPLPAAADDGASSLALCYPYAPKDADGDTASLLISVDANEPATLDIRYFKPDGTEAAPAQALTVAANATISVDLAAQNDLPAGNYHVVVNANRPILGAAHVRNANTLIGVYAAVDCARAADAMFGIFYAGSRDGERSVLHLMNSRNVTGTLTLNFIDPAGQVVHVARDLAIPAFGSLRYTTDDPRENFQFAAGYGRVEVVTSLAGIHGVLAKEWLGATTYTSAMWLRQSAALVCDFCEHNAVPRVHHESAESDLSLTTQLFLVAAGDSGGSYFTQFFRPNGYNIGVGWTGIIGRGTAHLRRVELRDPVTPVRGVSSLVVTSTPPLALEAEILPPYTPGITPLSVDSTIVPATGSGVVIPGLLYNDSAFSIFAVQNVGATPASLTIDLLDAQGQSVYSSAVEAPASAAVTVDLRQVAGLPQPFTGFARITGSSKLLGQLDLFSEVAFPPVMFLPYANKPVPPADSASDMVFIPAGPFQMGCDSANPAEDPCLPNELLRTMTLAAYAIDKYEVTNARYTACVAAGVCTLPRTPGSDQRLSYYDNPEYANYPVIFLDARQADAFCRWEGKRLPSVAEWQKAARGSSDTRKFPWGNAEPNCSTANALGCEQDTSVFNGYVQGASPYGVMNMAGNVAEFVTFTGELADSALICGGSWQDKGSMPLRIAAQSSYPIDRANGTVGFRCVRP